MTYATVRAAAEHIARTGKITPHQLAALTALDQSLSDVQRQEFTDVWRSEGSPAAKVTPAQTQQQATKLSPGSPFNAKITPNFTIGEFALGDPARRFVAQHQVDTAAELATFLERVRAHFGGKRITITSGYRPAAINRSVGGASGSEHLYNAPGVGAVDFYVDGADIKAVQDWCVKNWPYSTGLGASKGFVHLGLRAGRPRVVWDY
jgi:hypothetical protein